MTGQNCGSEDGWTPGKKAKRRRQSKETVSTRERGVQEGGWKEKKGKSRGEGIRMTKKKGKEERERRVGFLKGRQDVKTRGKSVKKGVRALEVTKRKRVCTAGPRTEGKEENTTDPGHWKEGMPTLCKKKKSDETSWTAIGPYREQQSKLYREKKKIGGDARKKLKDSSVNRGKKRGMTGRRRSRNQTQGVGDKFPAGRHSKN